MNVMFYFRHHYEFSLFTHHSSLFFWWNLGFHWNSIMTLIIYLFTMPRTVRTPDSFHWKLGLWLLQFNSPASFFVIFVHSKFVPFLTHSSSLKWKFIFRILDGSNSEFQIKISKFWITLTGIIWCSAEISWCYLNHCPYLKFVHHHDQSRDWTTINSILNSIISIFEPRTLVMAKYPLV